MAVDVQRMTLQEFISFAQRPENANRLYEFIAGEVIEVSPGRTSNSELADIVVFLVRLYCRERGLPCHTTSGDGAYRVGEHVVAPDFAYKPTPMSDEYPDPAPPLWAVEIISPTDNAADIREKREIYRQAGILLWEIYPKARSIDVYPPGAAPYTVGHDATLDASVVLAGFALPVRELFPA